ncbi:MAG: nucleotidyl transferase AbiEii/AbiGii toxin family protein, partial [Fluviibacter sp.]
HHCYFGGGTAIALRYGEYRESVDIAVVCTEKVGI